MKIIRETIKERFDKVYLLTLSNRKDRHNAMRRQLIELGIEDLVEFVYATPFPFNDIIANAFNITKKGKFTKPNEYDCARNHYGIVRMAYDLGYSNILILEDDIRILKNKCLLNDYIERLPSDFDVVQFGGFTTDPNVSTILESEKCWVEHPNVQLWNASMYALSRKGMSYYIGFMNKVFWVADGPLYRAPKNSHIIKTYCSTIPIVIQADKKTVASDIRDEHNDTIDYANDNLYEKNVVSEQYMDFDTKNMETHK